MTDRCACYGLVLDRNKMPRVDNPQLVPKWVWMTLTQEQKDYVNANLKAGTPRED